MTIVFDRFPVPGVLPVAALDDVLVVAEVLAHLLIQRSPHDRLGQRLEQPVRAGQRDTTITGGPDKLAGSSQLLSRRRPRLLGRFLLR